SCWDLLIGKAKIAGSAQRRSRGAILQHGRVLRARSIFAGELPGMEQTIGKSVGLRELVERWPAHLLGVLGLRASPGGLSEEEHSMASTLAESRFTSPDRLAQR